MKERKDKRILMEGVTVRGKGLAMGGEAKEQENQRTRMQLDKGTRKQEDENVIEKKYKRTKVKEDKKTKTQEDTDI